MANGEFPEASGETSEQFLKVEKKNLGICRKVSIALTLGKILEQIMNNHFLIPSSIIS